MTTTQIVIFVIAALVYFISFIWSRNGKEDDLPTFLQFLSFCFVWGIALALTIGLNEQRKNKCPELEKVDNVYKIK